MIQLHFHLEIDLNRASTLHLLLYTYMKFSDGSSPKKTSPGRARALKVELEPGLSLGPSEKVEPEP